MRTDPIYAALLTVLVACASAAASPLTSVVADVETGPLRVLRNDGRYGAQGTWYRAADVGQQRTLHLVVRASVELGLGERHTAIFLYAPLELTTRTRLDRELSFRDTRFAQGTVVDHRYLFEGYRGSYLFRAVQTGALRLDVGASLQVRNAEVAFASADDSQFVVESDLGLVPALKLRVRYDTPWQVYAMLEADGLTSFGLIGGGNGGLLDTSLTLGTEVSEGADLFLRLRVYGGGAEVPDQEIENWAWFGSALIGVRADAVTLLERL